MKRGADAASVNDLITLELKFKTEEETHETEQQNKMQYEPTEGWNNQDCIQTDSERYDTDSPKIIKENDMDIHILFEQMKKTVKKSAAMS